MPAGLGRSLETLGSLGPSSFCALLPLFCAQGQIFPVCAPLGTAHRTLSQLLAQSVWKPYCSPSGTFYLVSWNWESSEHAARGSLATTINIGLGTKIPLVGTANILISYSPVPFKNYPDFLCLFQMRCISIEGPWGGEKPTWQTWMCVFLVLRINSCIC